jgi:phospho-N-acetylmuramoyl-pentapeptide-transferase
LNFPENAKYILIPMVVAFLAAAAAYPLYIRWLKSKQIGQYIREEGPQSHAVKAKTPTMGGLLFIAVGSVVAMGYMALLRQYDFAAVMGFNHPLRASFIVMTVAALCGLVGLADDYGKVTSRSNRGLSAKFRLLIEFFLGAVLAALLFWQKSVPDLATVLPVALGPAQALVNFLYLFAFAPFLITATTNSVNVHDGMDGLSAGTSILVFAALIVMLLMHGHIPLAAVAASTVGALAGFLIYNRYPAKVFMGDTGSLYLGGLMAALVFASGLALWFIPLALIYVAETLSVFSQVTYFKLTKEYVPEKPMSKPALIWLKMTKRLPGEGKRLFRMAPLHHHFESIAEEKGVPEWKVVACFWAVQFFLSAATVAVFLATQKPWTLVPGPAKF